MRGSLIHQVLQFIRDILEWEINSYVDDMAEHDIASTKIKTNKQTNKQAKKNKILTVCVLNAGVDQESEDNEWGAKTKESKKKEGEKPMEIQWIMKTSLWVRRLGKWEVIM